MKLILTAIALTIAAPAVAHESPYPHGGHAPTKPKSGAPAKPAHPAPAKPKPCSDKTDPKAKAACDKAKPAAEPAAHDHAH